jgi:hypothetical protein
MAQNKKTDNEDITILLDSVTEQDYIFVDLVMKGRPRLEAYKSAYPTQAADNTIRVMACRKWARPEIQALRSAISRLLTERSARKLEERIARMEALGMRAEAAGNLGAAFQCELSAGKLEGHYVDKHETTYKRDTADIEKTLRQIAEQYGNDTMKQIAASDGYSDVAKKILENKEEETRIH